MFCPNCGMKLSEGTSICPGCHKQIDAAGGFGNEQNYWHQDLDSPGSWERQGIADGGGFDGSSDFGGGFGDYSDDGFGNGNDSGGGFGDYSSDRFGNGNDPGGGFGGHSDNGGGNGGTSGRGGRPKLLVLGIIAGVLCLIVLVVMLVITGIIPIIPRNDPQDSSISDVTSGNTTSEADSNISVEEVRPNAVTTSHKYDLSNISVSVTSIEPPEIAEKSVAVSAISKVTSDSESNGNSVSLLIDDDQTTFWTSDPDIKNPVITLDFGIEKQIGIIEMSIGAWSSENDFQKYSMPQLMEMEVDGYVYPLTFSDTMTEQYIVFSESVKASELTFRVKKTTGDGCAISEIKTYN